MAKLGVIGKPSDWLIASDVDYKKVNELFDIELVDLDIKELIDKSKSTGSSVSTLTCSPVSASVDTTIRLIVGVSVIIAPASFNKSFNFNCILL